MGAMEHYVRRIDPQALRDPRDEPTYTEEMDINDVYYSYLASQKNEDIFAITDGRESERRGFFPCIFQNWAGVLIDVDG